MYVFVLYVNILMCVYMTLYVHVVFSHLGFG
jgi:hypothetical protein